MFDTEKFVSLIRERVAIWQVKSPKHKNPFIINTLWDEVSESFPGLTVKRLKIKWKNLKDQYRKESKKIYEGECYSSSWQHFYIMSFMKDIITREYPPESLNKGPSDEVNADFKTVAMTSSRDVDISQEDNESSSDSVTEEIPQKKVAPKRKRIASDLTREMIELKKKKLFLLKRGFEGTAAESKLKSSDDYHYFMTLIPLMENFTPKQKLKIRNKFNQVIMDEMETRN